ncbi:proteasome regulatory subunit [Babesia caballi]|uniref:Proteasome regulatory subunit n=1 Tax=Babesia caballi TaxID=5871 RepID=A0AAV4LU64_BABCB|nr:proteasome regulatory subunit [Babesia caballi]
MGDSGRNYRNLLSTFGGTRHTQPFGPVADTSEQVYISSLALLKMLKHGRVSDRARAATVGVGNSVSVEAVDPVYQTEMKDQLRRTGRPEVVVGWYHSHPGFGCWFSGTDVNTQQSFEQLNPRAVGVVIDPIQSVKGKVVIDCFRLISPHMLMMGQEPRQTTSNVGHLSKPTIIALVHGLNRNYYSIVINYRRSILETQMLLNYNRNKWSEDLEVRENRETVQSIRRLCDRYNDQIKQELESTPDELAVANVGKLNAKMHIENHVNRLLKDNSLDTFGAMLAAEMLRPETEGRYVSPFSSPQGVSRESVTGSSDAVLRRRQDHAAGTAAGGAPAATAEGPPLLAAQRQVHLPARSFRRLAPSGLLALPKFQECLGLIGTLGTMLAESLFFAFDFDDDGFLNFVDYARAVLTMLRGSDKRRLELSFRILHSAGFRDQCYSMIAEYDPSDTVHGIDLEAFKRIVNDITTTRYVLTGARVASQPPEHVERIFNSTASVCSDGVARITQHDFERAVQHCNEFMELLGASAAFCTVEASIVGPFGLGESPQASSSRPLSVAGSAEFPPKRSKTYINRTTIHRRKYNRGESDGTLDFRSKGCHPPWLSARHGLAVYFGHERWNDVINMMVGLGLTSRMKHTAITRDLVPEDFTEKLTFSISPDTASGLTTSLNVVEQGDERCNRSDSPNKVVFTEHAPLVFKRLRMLSNLSEEEYLQSVGPEHLVGNLVLGNLSTMSELLSEGRSGALFFFTANGRLVLKTVTRQCAEFVQRWLPSYYAHTEKNPESLITRFVGLFSMTQCKNPSVTTYFIVMNNVFYSSVAIHRRYDLKGSWVGRTVPEHGRKDHTVALKDLDMAELEEYVELGAEQSKAFIKVLARDVEFLADSMLMDYSLLLGIHYRSISEDEVNWEVDPDPAQYACMMGKHRDRLGTCASAWSASGGACRRSTARACPASRRTSTRGDSSPSYRAERSNLILTRVPAHYVEHNEGLRQRVGHGLQPPDHVDAGRVGSGAGVGQAEKGQVLRVPLLRLQKELADLRSGAVAKNQLSQGEDAPSELNVDDAAVHQKQANVPHQRAIIDEGGLVDLVVAAVLAGEGEVGAAPNRGLHQTHLTKAVLQQHALGRGADADGGVSAELYAQRLSPLRRGAVLHLRGARRQRVAAVPDGVVVAGRGNGPLLVRDGGGIAVAEIRMGARRADVALHGLLQEHADELVVLQRVVLTGGRLQQVATRVSAASAGVAEVELVVDAAQRKVAGVVVRPALM